MSHHRGFKRRQALWLGGQALAGWGLAASLGHRDRRVQALEDAFYRDFTVDGAAPLKDRAAAKGIVFGAAARHDSLLMDPPFAERFAQECGLLVPEWELKWSAGPQPLRPAPHQFDFTRADQMATFARSHQLQMRGHTLVWHLSLPDWLQETVNSQNARQFLVSHIQTVVGHYQKQMHSWDVVNEAIALEDGNAQGLRQTPWLTWLGPDYIELAFQTAAEADPQAQLVYNDYGLEYDRQTDEAKRTAVLKLLERLKSKGTPIHALGIQSHLGGDATDFNPDQLRQFLRDVASLGLQIFITELDVIDQKLPADPLVRDRRVASVYEDYLSVVLEEPAVTAVLTWGLSDRYTWLSQFNPRTDGAPVRPLPLDANLERKLAWNAIARALNH